MSDRLPAYHLSPGQWPVLISDNPEKVKETKYQAYSQSQLTRRHPKSNNDGDWSGGSAKPEVVGRQCGRLCSRLRLPFPCPRSCNALLAYRMESRRGLHKVRLVATGETKRRSPDFLDDKKSSKLATCSAVMSSES